jgi:hypothetical protein
MVFHKNVFTQFSEEKHLSFSTVVIGCVSTIFRGVKKLFLMFFMRNCNKAVAPDDEFCSYSLECKASNSVFGLHF